MEFNFDRALLLALQRLDSPMRLKPEQLASVSAVCKGKDVFMWLPTGFGKSVCYETTPFITETIPLVMDCKRRRVDSESGKYSSSLVQYITSSSMWDWERHMPLLIRFGLDNYAHARTVDTRPFFFGQVGPGNEAKVDLIVKQVVHIHLHSHTLMHILDCRPLSITII